MAISKVFPVWGLELFRLGENKPETPRSREEHLPHRQFTQGHGGKQRGEMVMGQREQRKAREILLLWFLQ